MTHHKIIMSHTRVHTHARTHTSRLSNNSYLVTSAVPNINNVTSYMLCHIYSVLYTVMSCVATYLENHSSVM